MSHLHEELGIEVLNMTANSGSWQALTFDYPVRKVVLRARSAVAFMFSDDTDGASYITIPSGSPLEFEIRKAAKTVGYVKSGGADVVVECLGRLFDGEA